MPSYPRPRTSRWGGAALLTALAFVLMLVLPTIALGIAGPAVQGTITDANTTLELGDAYVEGVYIDGADFVDFWVTDSGGGYSLFADQDVPATDITVSVVRGGYYAQQMTVPFNAVTAETVDFALEPVPDDVFEVDDTAAAANLIVANAEPQQRTLGENDVDWVTISVTAGVEYNFFASSEGDGLDTMLGLYEADGTTLILEEDDTVGSSPLITWVPVSDQQVLLKATASADQPRISGDYQLGVTDDVTPPVDEFPVTAPDFDSTLEDTNIQANPLVSVLNNDIDPEAGPLTAELVAPAEHGIALLYVDGTYDYFPDENFNGVDVFTYSAADLAGNSAVETVTITVDAVDDVPVAVSDDATINEDAELTGNVLTNDLGIDGDALSAEVVTGPGAGTLVLNPDGIFTYTPNLNVNGPDGFTYRVHDTTGNSADLAVVITVTPVNDAPVAVVDDASTDEDVALSGDVLANDTDVDTDHASLTATEVSGPTSGSLTLNADGTFEYTPNANFSGVDSFTYRVSDGVAFADLPVTINVNPLPDAPVALADSATASEDVTLIKDAANGVLANDTDPDTLVGLTAVKVSDPAHGTVALNANGSYSYAPAKDFSGTDAFSYKAKDATDLESVAVTVTITVAEAADPTILNITSADKTLAAYGASYALTGKLVAADGGAGLGGRSIVVQSSKTRTGTFTDTKVVAVTAADGSFSATLKPTATAYYRVRFAGDAAGAGAFNSSVSASAVRVTAQVAIGTPAAPLVMRTTRAATVYGTLKARHAAGSTPVRIYKWRFVGGKWKAMGYVNARTSNYLSFSRYSASVKLSSKGQWKLRAYHVADASHPARWSTKSDIVTVR